MKSSPRAPPLKSKPHHLARNLNFWGKIQTQCRNPIEIRHPVILPKEAAISQKIIMATHETLDHSGASQVLYQLRQSMWPMGRLRAIESFIYKRLWSPCRLPRAAKKSDDTIGSSTPKYKINKCSPIPIFRGRWL